MALPLDITTKEFASLLDISLRTVNSLCEKGILQKLGHGLLNFSDSARAYVCHRETVVAEQHSAGELGQTQIALNREKLAILRLDRREREGQVLAAVEVINFNTALINVFKTSLLGLGNRLGPQVAGTRNPAQAAQIIDRAILELLTEFQRLTQIGIERKFGTSGVLSVSGMPTSEA
jgi:hypothetical protein